MRKIKVVVLLVQQLQHGFTKNAKVSPNLTVAHILHACTIYNPILVKFVHVTTLHLGVPLMGRQQIEAPWTFHMALAYFCDISSLLCNKVCVQVN